MKQAFDKLDKTINDFVKTFFEDYHAEVGLEFLCYLDTCSIEYAIFGIENNVDSFYENFVSRFPVAKNFSVFTLSLLHELGHLETEDIMIDDTEDRKKKLTDKEYYNLYNERIATNWVGMWIEDNLDKAKEINNLFIKLLDDIYKTICNK